MVFKQRLFTILLGLLFATVLTDQASALYDPGVGRFCSRDPIGYEGSQWCLYEIFSSMPYSMVDFNGLQGHKVIYYCGGKPYQDYPGLQQEYGCCANKKLYKKRELCCDNDRIEPKVPIWITTAPLFENQYPRNICAGWDTCMVPLNVFGWNPCHSTICLDGPTKGCLGPDANYTVIIPWDRDMQEVCEIDWNDVRINKKWVCPAEKERLRDLIGTPWSYNAITHNCHQFVGEQGYPLW